MSVDHISYLSPFHVIISVAPPGYRAGCVFRVSLVVRTTCWALRFFLIILCIGCWANSFFGYLFVFSVGATVFCAYLSFYYYVVVVVVFLCQVVQYSLGEYFAFVLSIVFGCVQLYFCVFCLLLPGGIDQ